VAHRLFLEMATRTYVLLAPSQSLSPVPYSQT